LSEAGVATTLYRGVGMFHGSHYMASLIPDLAERFRNTVFRSLSDAYNCSSLR
jgi:CRISPR/Cas system-associated endonuclease Cas1